MRWTTRIPVLALSGLLLMGCQDQQVTVPTVPADGPLYATVEEAAVDRIGKIKTKVDQFSAGGSVSNAGISRGLNELLSNASDAAGQSRLKASENMMKAFQNRVRAQRGKHIKDVAAQELDTDAQGVVDVLNGATSPNTADLSVQLSVTPDPVGVGENLTHTFTLVNAGPDAASDVKVVLQVIGTVDHGSMPAAGCTSTAAADGSSLSYECVLSSVAAGSSTPLSVAVLPQSAGEVLTSQVDIITWTNAEDPDLTNNLAAEVTEVTSRTQSINMPGSFGAQGEVDLYPFQSTAGTVINAAYTESAIDGRVRLQLLGPSGAVLRDSWYVHDYAESGPITLTADGAYTVKLEATDANSVGNYTLGIAILQDPAAITLASPYVDQSGSIRVHGDRQYFKFTGAAGDVVNPTIAVTSPLNAYIRLRRPGAEPFYARPVLHEQRALSYLASAAYTNAELGRITLPENGEYIVEVAQTPLGGLGSTLGDYRLRVFEPPIQSLSVGVEQSARIDPLFEFDRYQVSIDASAHPAVLIYTHQSVVEYLYTHLYGPDGAQIAWNRSNKFTSSANYHEIGPVRLATGTYEIVQDASGVGTGDYRMHVISLAAPTELTAASPSATAELRVAGERDYYKFSGTASQSVTLEFSIPSTSTLTGTLRVYSIGVNGDFTRPVTMVYSDPHLRVTPGQTISRTLTLPADGTYIVEADGLPGADYYDTVGAYGLRVTF